jgi:hypothetical protein
MTERRELQPAAAFPPGRRFEAACRPSPPFG